MSITAESIRSFSDYAFAPALETPPDTETVALDRAVERLGDGARRFARLSLPERIELASAMQRGWLRVAEASVRAGCAAKGLDFDAPESAEEWATGPWCVIRHLRLVRESLQGIRRSGTTPIGRVGRCADGRVRVNVFPANAIDGMLFQGCRAEVRMQQGVSERAVAEQRAGFYRGQGHDGRLVLVLGAGNIASIGPMDVITKLFNEGKACILKMNPVNAYLGPFIEQAFAEPIRQGFLAVVYGGVAQGAHLASHPGVDEIHITGSDRTHDAIVWGPPGAEREARMARNDPLLGKPVTSELGNVSPVILVPGPYSERELAFQAEETAAYTVMNASFLCNAAKMLVTPRGWPARNGFLGAVQRMLEGVPPRKAYYPGAAERWQALSGGREGVVSLGRSQGPTLPWTLIRGLDPARSDEPLFRTEAFCSILAETPLGSADPVEFLDAAVEFANRRLWGTLSATLVVHPKTLRDPRSAEAVERAIARLRYGTVGVNVFPGMGFAFCTPPWGAYPGSPLNDIQSGRGWVHNTSMLEGIEKTVLRFPLTQFPKPVYHPSHRRGHKALRALVRLEENARWSRLPPVVFHAMGG